MTSSGVPDSNIFAMRLDRMFTRMEEIEKNKSGVPDSNIFAMNLDRMFARMEEMDKNRYKLSLSKTQLVKGAIYSRLPKRTTVLKGIAVLAIAGLLIYNREAIGAFAKKEWTQIKDFLKGKYNHYFSGAQAGDAGRDPAVSGFGIDANGHWAWRS